MTEYIEREEINKAMKEVCDDPSCPMHVAAEIAQIIDCAPTADVVPVVHGKWIESANFDAGFWVCSKCRFVSEAIAAHKLYGYCPNCGAKMDGGTVDG